MTGYYYYRGDSLLLQYLCDRVDYLFIKIEVTENFYTKEVTTTIT